MPMNFKNPSRLFAWFYSLFCPIYGKSFYRELLKELEINGNESILDFGSGAGILAKKLVKKVSDGGTLTCLDMSKSFLNKVQKELKKFTNVDYILGDICELDLPLNLFDKIFITWVLHHIVDEEKSNVVGAIVKTLKLEGKIYVIEFLSQPHGILESDLINLFNKFGLSSNLIYRKKNTAIFEFKRN